MNLKKFSIGLGLLLLVGVLIFQGCGHSRFFCNEEFPEKALERLDNRVSKLELNDRQQEYYTKLRAEIKVDLTELRDSRLSIFDDVNEELSVDKPNMKRIGSIVKSEIKKHPVKVEKYIDKFVGFYEILNEEQQGKILKRMRKVADYIECD